MIMNGLLTFSVLLLVLFAVSVTAADTKTPYIGIKEVGIEGFPDEGYVTWKLVDFEDVITQTGAITVKIDDEIVLEKSISTHIRVVTGVLIAPNKYECFELNASNGTHRVEVVIVSENGVREESGFVYEGESIYTREDAIIEEEEGEMVSPLPDDEFIPRADKVVDNEEDKVGPGGRDDSRPSSHIVVDE